VDEVILTPVSKIILKPRVETLLRTRYLVQELQKSADVDSLTAVLNRRRVLQMGEQEYLRSERYSRPLSVIMLDIDYFKRINDRYGHYAGDLVLADVAARVQAKMRDPDLLGRYGGEEFIIILPETQISDAQSMAERIRASIDNAPVEVSGNVLHITISLGVVECSRDTKSFQDLVSRADERLYKAKRAGRNCVVAS
jgi:diguanylate cyclase (GGDEF)-like protein